MEQIIPHVHGADPVGRDGPVAFRCLHIDLNGICRVTFRIRSMDSPYKQGIALSLRGDPAFPGTAMLDGQPLAADRKRLIHVIPAAARQEHTLVFDQEARAGMLLLSSASDLLGSYPGMLEKIAAQTRRPIASLPAESWISGFSGYRTYGNSLIPEALSPAIIRCHCSDHVNDGHYSNLVFDMELHPTDAPEAHRHHITQKEVSA